MDLLHAALSLRLEVHTTIEYLERVTSTTSLKTRYLFHHQMLYFWPIMAMRPRKIGWLPPFQENQAYKMHTKVILIRT